MPNKGGLTDREAAIDALHRFLWSLDEGSDELAHSSLTEGAVMELHFTHNGSEPRRVTHRDNIVPLLMDAVGKPLDTTHMATNIRCEVKGDTAELKAQILAQHFRKGEGADPEKGEFYLNGNLYRCVVVRVGEEWRMSVVDIRPAWVQGNPEVMKV